ncbi:MAG TPA: hypothetical protein VFA89_07965 [Terriglobales bacterium]|nr:hypothetical protein [Terriglobales bacterium]
MNMFRKRAWIGCLLALFLSIPLFGMAQDQDAPPAPQEEQGGPPPQDQASPGGHQGRRGRGGMMASPEQRLEHMSQALNLTDDQKAKIKPMLDEESSKLQSLRSDSSMSQQDRRAKFMQIHQETLDQMKTVLNSDQQKKLAKMQERMKEHMNGQTEGPK